MKALRSILIVEPSEIIIEGLKTILGEAVGFNVLAPLHDAQQLVERVISQQPDLLLINPTLIQFSSPSILLTLQRRFANLSIVALVYQYAGQQATAGYSAVVDLRDNRSHIVSILNECCSHCGDDEESENYELTERETDVLVLLAQGYSSKEIADQLHISIHTVNTHRKNITRKTGIKSVAGLAVYATLHKFING